MIRLERYLMESVVKEKLNKISLLLFPKISEGEEIAKPTRASSIVFSCLLLAKGIAKLRIMDRLSHPIGGLASANDSQFELN